MQALLGLRGPSIFPAPPSAAPKKKAPGPGPGPAPRRPGQGWGIPGFDDNRDEDTDSWCCELILFLLVSTANDGEIGRGGKREPCLGIRRSVSDFGVRSHAGICNADATMRCLECADLYCTACWREHGALEEHRGKAYVYKRR